MIDRAKQAIADLLVICHGIEIESAEEIVQAAQDAVNDYLAGDSEYTCVSEILFEFLGLSNDYAWIFLYDNSDIGD